MSLVLLTSILIRIGALAWSLVIVRRNRDWRMLYLSTMLALMASRQILTALAAVRESGNPGLSLLSGLEELPGLAVSVMAFLVVLVFDDMAREVDRVRDRPRQAEIEPRRFARNAIAVGVLTIVACCALGYLAAGAVRSGMKEAIASNNRSLAARLGTHVVAHIALGEISDDRRSVQSNLALLWSETEPEYEGSYLCFIEPPGVVALHTGTSSMVGRDMSRIVLPRSARSPEMTLGDLLQAGADWSGENTDAAGVRQLVGYASVDGLGGVVVVHTPLELVEADLRAAATPWVLGLALIGGLLVPLTLGLLHRGYASVLRLVGHSESRRMELEAQLQQSQKMEAVGRLAGGVAHDFNNILTVILGNVELARAGIAAGPADHAGALAGLDEIERAGRRAAELTRQLLAFSRKQVARLEPLELNDVVAGMEPMIRRLIGEDVALTVELDFRGARVLGDVGLLEQVILNLVVNARDAMPDGGRLTIETRIVNRESEDGSSVAEASVRVTDTGCGMDAATAQRIFEPFFTTKSQGTGLGLAMVYGNVEKMGGHISVESEPRRGSSFDLRMPLATEAGPDDSPAPAAQAKVLRGETVVVCEDNAAVRELVCGMLVADGYEVLSADCGARARELAAEHGSRIDLLLTDVILPDTDGRAVAQALEHVCPRLKVLFMSGYPGDAMGRRGLSGDVELLSKPFSSAELLDRVDRILREG